jgi:hypothetical protein
VGTLKKRWRFSLQVPFLRLWGWWDNINKDFGGKGEDFKDERWVLPT